MIIVFESDYTNLDRWFPLDRYPRQLFKKLIKKGTQLTGQSKALENTRKGLDKLGFNYMLNPKEKKIQSSEIPVMLFGQTKVNQYILGYENRLREDILFKVEGFIKEFYCWSCTLFPPNRKS